MAVAERFEAAPELHERITAGQNRFAANVRRLEEQWSALLAEHRGEWVAVFDGRTVLASTPAELVALIPANEVSASVVRFIAEPEGALLL